MDYISGNYDVKPRPISFFGTGCLIHIAAEQGRLDLVKFLVSLGADTIVSRRGDHKTPLHLAVDHFLLDHERYNNQRSRCGTPLYIAVDLGSMDMVHFLLDHGGYNNQRSRYGTPLYIAMKKGIPELVQILLNREDNTSNS